MFQILCFKFQEYRIINEEFDFWRGGGYGDPIHEFELLLVNMFCFKFQQNRTINEEFDFFLLAGCAVNSLHKFESQLSLANI